MGHRNRERMDPKIVLVTGMIRRLVLDLRVLLPAVLACGCSALPVTQPVPVSMSVDDVEEETGWRPTQPRPIVAVTSHTTPQPTLPSLARSSAEPPETTPPETTPPRVGPLDWWPHVGEFSGRLGEDLREISGWENVTVLGIAAAGAVVVHQDLDDEVRDSTARTPLRWGKFSEGLGVLGNAEVQVPILLGSSLYASHSGDQQAVDMHRSLIESYALMGLGTLVIKAAVNSDRPSEDWNGGQFGFPSFHAASSFTIASVLQEYHGPRVGLPASLLAGLISYSRIDERDHDLSDVLFGATFGWLVGRSVSRWHRLGDGRLDLLPWSNVENRAVGLSWLLEY